MPQARQRPGTVLAVAMPVSRSVAGMVMLAGPGKHLTHASQHPSDDALQHVNNHHPDADARRPQRRGRAPAHRAGDSAPIPQIIPTAAARQAYYPAGLAIRQ